MRLRRAALLERTGHSPYQGDAFRFLKDTLVPDGQRRLALLPQLGQSQLGAMPEQPFQRVVAPLGRAQQIAEPLSAGRRAVG